MGCGSSKVDDLPLVTLCRERRGFIKAASDHRYALAAAHVSYFQSLKDIGDALRKFVDEEIVVAGADSSSFPGSPVLTLPSDEGKRRKPKPKANHKDKLHDGDEPKNSSSSASISNLNSPGDEEIEDSHLHLASGSDSDSELGSSPGHIRMEESVSPKEERETQFPPQNYYPGGWASPVPPEVYTFMHFAKKSETPMQSMVYEEPEAERYYSSSSYGNSGYSFPQYSSGGFYGFSMGSPPEQNAYDPYRQPNPPAPPPAPPSPPKVTPWDYLNFFDTYENSGYPANYPRYGYGSNTSSPDSAEVREREGIPDLEDETETEGLKKGKAKKKVSDQEGVNRDMDRNSGEGTSSPAVPPKQNGGEGSSRPVPMRRTYDSPESVEVKTSSGTIDSIETITVSKSPDEESTRKKGVSFEIDEAQNLEVESSKPSSLTTLSVHGTRDLQEVVKEIRDEFETASGYGKEVAMLLEVGKLPYQLPRATALGGI